MSDGRGHVTAFAVAAAGIAVFSAMDVLMKGLSIAIGTYVALVWRNLAAVAIGGTLYLASGDGWPARSTLRVHLIRGAVTTIMALLFFWGLARLPMAQAIALSFVSPLLAQYLSAVMLKERVAPAAVAASLIAAVGVGAILAGQARADLGPEALTGALAVLGSALCYAFNIVLMRQQAQVAKPAEVAFFQALVVAGLLLLAAPWMLSVPPKDQWTAIVAAAVLGTVSAMLLAWGYARAPASHMAPTEYTAFVWASLFGWAVFGETVSGWTVVGAALIVTGCIVAVRTKPIEQPTLEPQA
ncbi:S-adenosylmethionine uptake transporter [Sphingomonas jejuensis]|uniref:S-adenosylmethionine uptake transporter n=1 Tax=Sphingomonas jejuensis TaxID=904715 RepID=A0ABX0XP45_9SPHN|nr:S-adenosylmethionine uptake transporter [Sphingomonas jejuensis]